MTCVGGGGVCVLGVEHGSWQWDSHRTPRHTPRPVINSTGSGLGRLLFYELFARLSRQWGGGAGLLKLEAEEDTRRHDRLVRYYQSLGFRPTPDARVLYLSHDDAYFRYVGWGLGWGVVLVVWGFWVWELMDGIGRGVWVGVVNSGDCVDLISSRITTFIRILFYIT